MTIELRRQLALEQPQGDTIPATLATEVEVPRDGYVEILQCTPAAVDLSRAPLPLIESHDGTRVNVGICENVRIERGRLRADIRFGSSARGRELHRDVVDRVVTNLSIGYLISDFRRDGDRLIAVRWMPFEASVVSVPADPGAGFFRSSTMPQQIFDRRQVDNFSLLNLIDARASGKPARAEREIGMAHRAVDLAALQRTESRGDLIPLDVLRRDLNTGTPSAGGALVGGRPANTIIESLQPRPLLMRLGAEVLGGLGDDLSLPRGTADPTVTWLDEGDEVTASDPTFDDVALAYHDVSAQTEVSRRLLKQSSPDIEAYVLRTLARSVALALEREAFVGDGTGNKPTGILETASVQSFGTGTITPTANIFLDGRQAIEDSSAEVNADTLAYVMSPSLANALAQTPWSTGSSRSIIENRRLDGIPVFVSTYLPASVTGSTGTAILADWSQLVIGEFSIGGIDLLVDPYSSSKSGKARLTAFYACDIALRHPESFCAGTFDVS